MPPGDQKLTTFQYNFQWHQSGLKSGANKTNTNTNTNKSNIDYTFQY